MAARKPTGPKLPPNPGWNEMKPNTFGEIGTAAVLPLPYVAVKGLTVLIDKANHHIQRMRRAAILEAETEREEGTGTEG